MNLEQMRKDWDSGMMLCKASYRALLEHAEKLEAELSAARLVAATSQGMADCMDMVRQELVEAGVIDKSIAPMFIANAVVAHCAARTRQDHEQALTVAHALMAERDAAKASLARLVAGVEGLIERAAQIAEWHCVADNGEDEAEINFILTNRGAQIRDISSRGVADLLALLPAKAEHKPRRFPPGTTAYGEQRILDEEASMSQEVMPEYPATPNEKFAQNHTFSCAKAPNEACATYCGDKTNCFISANLTKLATTPAPTMGEEAELAEAIKRGTKAWAGVEVRGGAAMGEELPVLDHEAFAFAMGLSCISEIDYDGKPWTTFVAGVESGRACMALRQQCTDEAAWVKRLANNAAGNDATVNAAKHLLMVLESNPEYATTPVSQPAAQEQKPVAYAIHGIGGGKHYLHDVRMIDKGDITEDWKSMMLAWVSIGQVMNRSTPHRTPAHHRTSGK